MKTHLTVREGRSLHGERDRDRVLWLLAASGQRDRESDNQGTAGSTEAGLSEQGTAGWAHSEKHEQGRV